jgi:hypothetical protein
MTFHEILNKEDLPEKNFEKKFIQIYIENDPYLRIAKPIETHQKTLRRTLNEFEIEIPYIEITPSLPKITPLKGKGYEMVGAGFMKRNDETEIILHGESGFYRKNKKPLGPNEEHLEKILLKENLNIKIKQ